MTQVLNHGKLLAIADEEGYISVIDTHAERLPTSLHGDSEVRPKAQWLAHHNTVFDIAWAKGDTRLYTAAGDQSVGVWDTGRAALVSSLRGHNGSIKSVCPQRECSDVVASGGSTTLGSSVP